MLISSAISFIFSFLSAFSINVWMLIVTRFLTGFFVSGISSNSYAYLGEFFCEKSRAKYINLCSIFMAFSLTLSPSLGWIFLQIDANSFVHFSMWRVFLLVCSSISFVIAVSLYFLAESPKFLLAKQRDDEALKVLERIYKWNKGGRGVFGVTKIDINEAMLNNSNSSQSCWAKSIPLFKPPLLKSTLKISFLMFSFFANSSGFFMWTPDILNQILDYPNLTVCEVTDKVIISRVNQTLTSTCEGSHVNGKIYEITFMMGCFFSLIYFINAFVINKVGKNQLLAFWFLVCALASFLIPFFRNYFVILFLLLIFLTSGVCGAIVSSIIVDIYPTQFR
jgi:MFS transporter, VNT family, synaptic vesicle glycoprotein 2